MVKVTKAVIPAAGFGTRFLPQTKAMPKEMLPLIDKPIIQYVVEALVEAGVTDIIIVGNSNKRAVEDHFDTPNEDLLANLRAGGDKKQPLIDEVEQIAGLANFMYIRQKGLYGTGTPLRNVAHLIGDEPFLHVIPDDLIMTPPGTPNAFQQMIALHEETGGSVVTCIKVSTDYEYDRYGVLAGDIVREGVIKMSSIIEHPGRANAPSDFASVGGYLFTADILKHAESGLSLVPEGKEFLITDYVIAPAVRAGLPFYGLQIQDGQLYDTGDKLGYLKAVFDFALKHDEVGPELREYLRRRLND